jgi:hypothetical protein
MDMCTLPKDLYGHAGPTKDIAGSALTASIDSFDWVQRLIQIDTSTVSGNLALFDLAMQQLRRSGASTAIDIATQRGCGVLLSTFPDENGRSKGGIVFVGDCEVPSMHVSEWTSDPFQPVVKGGRLFGLGASNTKGFLGLLLGLAPVIKASSLSCPVHIVLRFKTETGKEQPSPFAIHPYPIRRIVHQVTALGSVHARPTSLRVVADRTFPALVHSNGTQRFEPTLGSVLHSWISDRPSNRRTAQRRALSERGAQQYNAQSDHLAPAQSMWSNREPVFLAWGPGVHSGANVADESIEVDELAKCSIGLKQALRALSSDMHLDDLR